MFHTYLKEDSDEYRHHSGVKLPGDHSDHVIFAPAPGTAEVAASCALPLHVEPAPCGVGVHPLWFCKTRPLLCSYQPTGGRAVEAAAQLDAGGVESMDLGAVNGSTRGSDAVAPPGDAEVEACPAPPPQTARAACVDPESGNKAGRAVE